MQAKNYNIPAVAGAQLLMNYRGISSDKILILQNNLTGNELQCVAFQLLCPRLNEMVPTDQHNAVVDLMSEIKLLTGAIVHTGDLLGKQIEMIKRFLVTGFNGLSKQEIVQAFYLNNQGELDDVFKHFGRELNAEFMGDVLRAYLRYKKDLARSKGKLIAGILNPPPRVKIEVDYDSWKEIVQADYELFCKKNPKPTLWHARKYYTLRKFGLMPYRNVAGWIFFVKLTIPRGRGGLNIPAGADLKDYTIQNISQLRALFTTSEGYASCVDAARQVACEYVFSALRDCGIYNIWTEVAPTKTMITAPAKKQKNVKRKKV